MHHDQFFIEGKSSFGNTIVGSKQFKSSTNPNGTTAECKCASRNFDDKRLFVVDTPGFMDPRIHETDIQNEIAKAYQVTALPGPHALLFTIAPKTITPEEIEALTYLNKIFDGNAINNTIIIFTHADAFDPSEEETIETYLQALSNKSPLKILLDQCHGRYLSVNNRGTETEKNKVIAKLIETIGIMVAKNNGQIYRTTKFDEVAAVIREEGGKGNYNPINPDGSIVLHPKIEKIIVESFLRRMVGRKIMQ